MEDAKSLSKNEYIQNWSLDKDTSEIPGDNPMFMILGTFESEDAAKEFLDTYQDHKDVAKACISMYNFVKVRDIETVLVQRHYQDPQQQQLMDAFFKARKVANTNQ